MQAVFQRKGAGHRQEMGPIGGNLRLKLAYMRPTVLKRLTAWYMNIADYVKCDQYQLSSIVCHGKECHRVY